MATRGRISPYFWMLGSALAFATMGSLAHALRSTCDWQLIAFTRSLLAFVFAITWARRAGATLAFFRPLTLWWRSLAGSLSMMCVFFSFSRLPVADVLTLTNMFPIWVALLSWPILREAPTLAVWLGVATGVLGVAMIQQPHFAEGNFAIFVALASSVTTALAMMGLHRLRWVDPRAIVAHFSMVSTGFAAAAWFAFDHRFGFEPLTQPRTLVMLLGVGVFATIGQLLITKAFAAGSPAKVSVVGLSQVAIALGYEWAFWEVRLDLARVVGIGLVIGPTAAFVATGFGQPASRVAEAQSVSEPMPKAPESAT